MWARGRAWANRLTQRRLAGGVRLPGSSYRLALFHLQRALVRRGAPVLLRLAALYRRSALRRTTLIAVVGTYGKTTTTRAIKVALGLPVERGTRRNAGASLAVELLRFRPLARCAVLEVAIKRPGQMAELAAILCPDVTVVTTIEERSRSSAI